MPLTAMQGGAHRRRPHGRSRIPQAGRRRRWLTLSAKQLARRTLALHALLRTCWQGRGAAGKR